MALSRIGLIADAHFHGEAAGVLPESISRAFQGVDRILALGDMGEAPGLDALEALAPVVGTLGGDDPAGDPRLLESRIVEVEGVSIGAVFQLARPGGIDIREDGTLELPEGPVGEHLAARWGRPVDVVAYGGTHVAAVAEHEGVLFVNPGSPTFAARKTVAILEVGDGRPRAEIVEVG